MKKLIFSLGKSSTYTHAHTSLAVYVFLQFGMVPFESEIDECEGENKVCMCVWVCV